MLYYFVMKTAASARLFWSWTRGIRYAPIRAHSRSETRESENQKIIEKAAQLLGKDLAGLIHKVDPTHPLIDMARY